MIACRVNQSLDLYFYSLFCLFVKTIVYYCSSNFFGLGRETAGTSEEIMLPD